jgi:hemolysin activation/secretion protein
MRPGFSGHGGFGDSFEHNKLTLAGSAYIPFGTETVFATNATLCSTGGDVPYYDLCLFGSGGVLRGYLSGRYRDRASWAVQGEFRHHFTSRWGAAAFLGFGGIAPSAGDFLRNSTILPAAGVGLRYRPFKDNDIHLRLDVAVGKTEPGVYLGIGEAF